MAEQLWYVDPDAVGGGTGVDWANAYTTLNAAETAKEGDITLAGSDQQVIFECRSSGDTADTTSTAVVGWTTDATHDITIRGHASHRHDGIYGNVSGAYKLETTNTPASTLLIQENYVTVDGIQIKHIINADDTFDDAFAVSYLDAGNLITVGNVILAGEITNTVKKTGLNIGDSDAIVYIYNTIIYGFVRRAVVEAAGATTDLYNCTISGATETDGVKWTTSTFTAKNNAVFNNTDDFDGTFTFNYNASDDDTGGGTNWVDISAGVEATEWAKAFTDYSGTPPDFSIKDASSVLYQAGESNTNDNKVPTTDIAGTARVDGSESIGAFESVAAGGLSIPVAIHHLRQIGGL